MLAQKRVRSPWLFQAEGQTTQRLNNPGASRLAARRPPRQCGGSARVSGCGISGRLRPCRCHFAPLKDWAKSSAQIRRRNLAPKALAPKETCMRPSRRQPDELRPVSLERGVVKYAEGSCFVRFGDTHVLVTATLEDRCRPGSRARRAAGSPPNTACCRARRSSARAAKRRPASRTAARSKSSA